MSGPGQDFPPSARVTAHADGARPIVLAVVVAALGYFVDIYDLVLFLVLRRKSLEGIGVSGDALLGTGFCF